MPEVIPLISIAECTPKKPVSASLVKGETRGHFLVYRDQDETRVFVDSCPHQGRSLEWSPGRFLINEDGYLVCPSHGAQFDLSTGECIAGICQGSSLKQLPCRVEDDFVILEDL